MMQGPQISPVEAAQAVIGLRPFISRKVEKITKTQIKEMLALPRKIQTLARKLVRNELGNSYHEKLNYRGMLKELSRGWDLDQLQAMAETFPAGMRATGAALVINASGLIKDLLAQYPVSTYQTVTGSANLLPSDSRLWSFISKLEVIDDPTIIFSLMASGALLVSQANEVRKVYPTISAYIDWAILIETIKAKTAKKTFELSPRAEIGVRAWMGKGPIDPKMLRLAQAQVQKTKDRRQQQSQPTKDSPDLTTQAQRSLTT